VRATLDANVLVYAFDAQGDTRGDIARQLVDRLARDRAFLPLQSLNETANVLLKRKVPAEAVAAYVGDLVVNFEIAASSRDDLDAALAAVRAHKLAFWDAMLWATCLRAGATTLFTEDFQDGRALRGVRFVNPFAAKNARLLPKADA